MLATMHAATHWRTSDGFRGLLSLCQRHQRWIERLGIGVRRYEKRLDSNRFHPWGRE